MKVKETAKTHDNRVKSIRVYGFCCGLASFFSLQCFSHTWKLSLAEVSCVVCGADVPQSPHSRGQGTDVR